MNIIQIKSSLEINVYKPLFVCKKWKEARKRKASFTKIKKGKGNNKDYIRNKYIEAKKSVEKMNESKHGYFKRSITLITL